MRLNTSTTWYVGHTFVNLKDKGSWHYQFQEDELGFGNQMDLENIMWARIFKAKYFPNASFFAIKSKDSQVWNETVKCKDIFNLGACFSVGNGKEVKFWLSKWVDDKPLYARYPNLFVIASNPEILVSDFFVDGQTNLAFMRSSCGPKFTSWEALKGQLDFFPLVHQKRFNELGPGGVKHLLGQITIC